MKKLNVIKEQQLNNIKEKCMKNGIDFKSMEKLLEAEKVKKLQKRNHYIQQTIDTEIEKAAGI